MALSTVLLLLSLCAGVIAIDPASATGCFVHNAVRYVAHKDGCRPHELVVSGCWGRCDTIEVPELKPPFVIANHRLCSITAVRERHVRLPDCDPGVDPSYTFADVQHCGCTNIDASVTKYSYRPDYLVSTK